MFGQTVTLHAAFGAGLLSFFTPCILPLIPAYFTFITGYSLDELSGDLDGRVRTNVILSTVSFVLGFSVVFVLLGASASLIGGLVKQYQDAFRIAGGVIVIILGLHLTGLFRLKFLEVDKRIHLTQKPVHILGNFVVGMAFGAGWSPCIGPLLGSIMAIAVTSEDVGQGILLLSFYSAGLALPFIGISLFINLLLSFVRKMNRVVQYVNTAAGVLLIGVGVLLVADKLKSLV